MKPQPIYHFGLLAILVITWGVLFAITLCGCSSTKLTEQELNSFTFEQHFQAPNEPTNTPCLTVDSYSVANGAIQINCSSHSSDTLKIAQYIAFEYANPGQYEGGTVRLVNSSLSKDIFMYPFDIDILGLDDFIYLLPGQSHQYIVHRDYYYPYTMFKTRHQYALVFYLGEPFCQDSIAVRIH